MQTGRWVGRNGEDSSADLLRLYIGETSGNNTKTEDYLFANNLAVIPEPSGLMLGLVGAGLLAFRRKR